jgi:hypothetical protein
MSAHTLSLAYKRTAFQMRLPFPPIKVEREGSRRNALQAASVAPESERSPRIDASLQ